MCECAEPREFNLLPGSQVITLVPQKAFSSAIQKHNGVLSPPQPLCVFHFRGAVSAAIVPRRALRQGRSPVALSLRVFVSVSERLCVCLGVRACVCVCTRVCMCACTSVCARTFVYACVCECLCVRACLCVHVVVCVH